MQITLKIEYKHYLIQVLFIIGHIKKVKKTTSIINRFKKTLVIKNYIKIEEEEVTMQCCLQQIRTFETITTIRSFLNKE